VKTLQDLEKLSQNKKIGYLMYYGHEKVIEYFCDLYQITTLEQFEKVCNNELV
jgi:hypothetical protein